ncbi:hypothetical protein [Nocardioides sp.]|uniref:hypothetical protein n=1 Tax=Nocardioides sp. TaxID=35761 RepID=UPI003513A5CD
MSLVATLLSAADWYEWTGLIIATAAVLGIALKTFRWARPIARKMDAALEVLVGHGEEPANTVNGTPARPAVPGIGARVARIEETLPTLVEAVDRLAKNEERLGRVEARVTALEEQAVERVVTKVESTAAWLAVEAVANQGGEHESPQIEE